MTTTEKRCPNCDSTMPEYVNYCSWDCGVELAKKAGGKVYTPNGLPIRCVRHDGNMYEHEHGDHPDYKFPVEATFTGPEDDRFTWVNGEGETIPMSDEEKECFKTESHALLYTDGSVAVTMYECCYAMWYLRDGEVAGGSLWKKGEWKLTPESVEKIRGVKSSG